MNLRSTTLALLISFTSLNSAMASPSLFTLQNALLEEVNSRQSRITGGEAVQLREKIKNAPGAQEAYAEVLNDEGEFAAFDSIITLRSPVDSTACTLRTHYDRGQRRMETFCIIIRTSDI